jgi:hypothetical protein
MAVLRGVLSSRFCCWKVGLSEIWFDRKLISSSPGPPGYGKTILSTAIIEDLNSLPPQDLNDKVDHSRLEVVYFYFNAQRPGKRSSLDAIRAIVAQAYEALLEDPEMADLISVFKAHQDRATSPASEDDLFELLLLAARRFSSLVLVLDGVDESADFEKMWFLLSKACQDQRIKCLCLGRPLPSMPSEHAHLIARKSLIGMNQQDIQGYFGEQIRSLQLAGDLPEDLNADTAAKKLASSADSRFLWASLMMAYLRSPALEPAARVLEIENSASLETLHGIYSGMLRQFESLLSQDRALLTKVFQFLVLAKEPPSLAQLNIATSSRPGRKLSNQDLVPNISDTVGRLCGDLLEIERDCTISFAHLSFRVFLLSKEAVNLNTPFRVDLATGSLRLATVCLSYLANDIPQRPLSGSYNQPADMAEIASQTPFAMYSAKYWVDHTLDALRLMPDALRELMTRAYPLFQQLGSLLSRKPSISVWIELCWTLGTPPSIILLWQELERRLGQVKGAAPRHSTEWQIAESLGQVRNLSDQLERLDKEWSHLLTIRPHEIWGSSIGVFLGSVSWAHNNEAKATMIANDDEVEDLQETILKVSKLSQCGRFLGIVRIWRPIKAL